MFRTYLCTCKKEASSYPHGKYLRNCFFNGLQFSMTVELSQYDLIPLVISSIFEFINERQHAIIEHEFEWLFNEAIKYKEGKNRKKLKGNF